MMAKMFYTMEEAKSALGKSEEEIRQFARDGRLREFRDGPRLMFKADQVEQLRAEVAGGGSGLDQVDLGVSDSGGLIGLVDTTGASGTSITLSDADTGQSSGAGMRLKDDTALAADLGLSGSLGGVPSPGRPGGSGTGLSGSMGGRSGAGINVFGTDDVVERVDPAAQTSISGGIRDQMELQGVGSGSGLLDLTRESDDTSLGAVLDEITPAGTTAGRRAPTGFDTGAGASGFGGTGMGMGAETGGFGSVLEEAPPSRVAAPPVYIQQADPLAPAFGAAALAAAGVVLFGAFALISSIVGTYPDALRWFGAAPAAPQGQNLNLFVIALMGLGITLVFFVIGLIIGKVAGNRR